jgi:hypothetical protein
MLLFLLMQWRRSGSRMHLVEPTYILLHFHWVYLFSHTQYFLIPYHRSAKGWFCIRCLQSCLLCSRQGFWKNSAWPWRMNDKRITLHRIHNYPSARLVIYRNRLKGKGTVKKRKADAPWCVWSYTSGCGRLDKLGNQVCNKRSTGICPYILLLYTN